MRVWIVNPFDNLPPEGYRPMRYWLMASAFARAGHDATYWTADFSHANKKPRSMAVDAPEPPFRLVLMHEPAYSSNVSLRRLWAHWRWAKAWRDAVGRETPPDVIVVSSPPLAIGGEVRRYASRTGAKVVVDVMDDWPGTFERVAPRWTLAPLRRLARANMRAASAVTVVADRYADLARGLGFAGRVERFYHGIELGAGPRRGGAADGSLRIVYAGSLGRTYDLATAMEALSLVKGATLDIAGAGERLEGLRRLAATLNAPVRFHGYLAEDALRELLASCDVGLVPMDPASCVGVPYKFADYARAGLAIASSLGGESGRLLARHGAGVAYRGGDPQSLAASLRTLAPRLAGMRAASRAMAEAEFDADAIYGRYVAFVEAVAAGGGSVE